MQKDMGASADADRAATPSEPSPAVSGKAGIPSAVSLTIEQSLRHNAALLRNLWAEDAGTTLHLHAADLMEEAATRIADLTDALATHPEYAADTTFASIWQWLARKDRLLNGVRAEQVEA